MIEAADPTCDKYTLLYRGVVSELTGEFVSRRGALMTLTFPNKSRSYDETGRRIRFSGYDGMIEVRFFLELDALASASPTKISGEPQYLNTFDMVRPTILNVASRVYAKGKHGNVCTLTVADFS